MTGIGDNFQLHILFADPLTGDPARGLLAGQPPGGGLSRRGRHRTLEDPIQRRLRLFDGTGAYIYPESHPAGILLLEGGTDGTHA
jgi:hypothetical protein